MSGSGQFCPRCGDPVGADPAERPDHPAASRRDRGLCDDCYFEQFDLVDAPERIEVRVCSGCGAVHRGNRWVDVGARDYTDVAIEETTEALGVHVDATDVSWAVDPEQVDENTVRMHCRFRGVVRGSVLEEAAVVPVRIARETCDRCGRVAGGYHNSLVQLRARDREPTARERERAVEIAEAYVADREATGDRNAFITEVSAVDGGTDIKISTAQMGQGVASRITDELGGTVEHHPTLVTEDADGQEVYRVTYAVRLPRFVPGDVVDPGDGDGPVLVRNARGKLTGVRLTDGEPFRADTPVEGGFRGLGTAAGAVETALVAVEDEHAVQVLDPETYETVSVPRPEYLDPDAETVPVLRSRAGLHVLPPDAPADRTDG